MPALFSDHTFRHYAYLRDSLSHLVPQLRVRLWCFEIIDIRHHYIAIILYSSKSLILSPLSVTRQEADGGFGLWVVRNGVLQSGVSTTVPPGESGSSHHPAEFGLTWSSGPARLYHQVWNTWLQSVSCDLFKKLYSLEPRFILSFSHRDLQRLGMLQTELAGSADFCATYLRCQLLLMKAGF